MENISHWIIPMYPLLIQVFSSYLLSLGRRDARTGVRVGKLGWGWVFCPGEATEGHDREGMRDYISLKDVYINKKKRGISDFGSLL